MSPFQGEVEGSIPFTRSSPRPPLIFKGETGALKQKMYTVYVLRSLKDNRTYLGCTKNLENRIKEHNAGEVESTKTRVPFVLWYKEEFTDKFEAFKREQHLKTAWGRRQLRKILDKKRTETNK